MADNIAVTAGSGTIVGADDVSSVYYQRVKQVVGADGTAVDYQTFKVSTNFNRPANATPYSINDAVNDNATAGSVTELQWTIPSGLATIRRVRVKKSDAGDDPTIRVWLYDASFATAAGDNAAFSQAAADCVGFVDVEVTVNGTDDGVGFADCDIPVVAATLYGQLETLTAFTPSSGETFTVTLWGVAG